MKKRVTYTLDEELIEQLKKVSNETMIPQSKLVEKSLKEIIKTHEGTTEYQLSKKEQSE